MTQRANLAHLQLTSREPETDDAWEIKVGRRAEAVLAELRDRYQ